MSDYDHESRKDQPITSSDYTRFITSRGGRPQCPCCQSQSWQLISEPGTKSYAFMNIDRKNPVKEDMHAAAVLMLVCQNCGFIAPILRDKVARWLDSNNG